MPPSSPQGEVDLLSFISGHACEISVRPFLDQLKNRKSKRNTANWRFIQIRTPSFPRDTGVERHRSLVGKRWSALNSKMARPMARPDAVDSHNAVCSLIELSNSPPFGSKRPLELTDPPGPPAWPKAQRQEGSSSPAEMAAMLLSPNTVMPMAIDNLLSSRHFSPRSAEFPSVLLTPSTVSELSARLDTQRAMTDAQKSTQAESLFLSDKRSLAEEPVLNRPNLSRLSSFLADAESPPPSQIYLSREGPPLFSSSMPWLSAPWLSSQLNKASQPLGRPSEKPASCMTKMLDSGLGGGRSATGQTGLTARWQASVWASLNDSDQDSKALLAPLVSCDPQEVPERLQRVPPQHLEVLPAETLFLVQQFRRYLATRQVPWQGEVAVRPQTVARSQPVRTTEMPRVLSQFDQLSHGQKPVPLRNRA